MTREQNMSRMKRAVAALEKAHKALEPFSWADPQWEHGGGFFRLRSEINSALDAIDWQLDSKRGWMLEMDEEKEVA